MSERRINREIRVFISSTFRDMQYERDFLIKYIFPEIRQACRERLVEFTEIDLRWGITELEAKQGKVVQICLEEINRCRPFFLGFMGERYGWQPTKNDIHHKDELVQSIPIVAPCLKSRNSVTEMEVLHGVLRSPAGGKGHAFFYLRSEILTNDLATKSGNRHDYYDTPDTFKNLNWKERTNKASSCNRKLLALKKRVKGSRFPYHDYSDLETLGQQVKADLLAVLDQLYPPDKTPTPLEAERMMHEAYAADRCRAYLPSELETDALDIYIQSRNESGKSLPIIIGGESGLGKSALIAYWLSIYHQAIPNGFVIQHYSGVSGDATPTAVLRRIMLEIKARNNEIEEVPSIPDEVAKEFPLWLAKIRDCDPLLLAIDAINQIECDSLNWLPSHIPQNVTLIVSVLPGTQFTQLKQRGWHTLQVQPLNEERRRLLIQGYLHKLYSKNPSTDQIRIIVDAPQCANPLFLITLLQELRVEGVFEELNGRIAEYLKASTPVELFAKVLERMERDYRDGNDEPTIVPVVKAIWASRKGLNETELLGITGLNRINLSYVLLAMDYHLSNKSGLYNFYHEYLRKAVAERYLKSEPEQRMQHRILAEYFEFQLLDARKADELPWQWQRAVEKEKLKKCISDVSMFHLLFKSNKFEPMNYWRFVDENRVPGLAYWQSMKETQSTDAEKILISTDLGEFFCRYYINSVAGELFLRHAICLGKASGSSLSFDFVRTLNLLVGLLLEQGLPTETESLSRKAFDMCRDGANPGEIHALYNLATLLLSKGNLSDSDIVYREAINKFSEREPTLDQAEFYFKFSKYLYVKNDRTQALVYAHKSLEIRKRILGEHHPATAASMNNVAVLEIDYKHQKQYFELALKTLQNGLGDNHTDTIVTLCNLAKLLRENEDYFSGDELLDRALRGWKELSGMDSLEMPAILINYINRQVSSHCDTEYEEVDSINMDMQSNNDEMFKPGEEARELVSACEAKYGMDALETASALEKLLGLCHKWG